MEVDKINDTEASVDDAKRRFELELEFVQCLANPWYLNHLAQQQYFHDPAFLNYLSYLRYWKKPEYACFIVYPHALYFLDLLQSASFREALSRQDISGDIHAKQFWHWLNYRNKLGEQQQTTKQAEN